MNPVVLIRAQAVEDWLRFHILTLRENGDVAYTAAQTHWEAQRLRSVCERELGTRER